VVGGDERVRLGERGVRCARDLRARAVQLGDPAPAAGRVVESPHALEGPCARDEQRPFVPLRVCERDLVHVGGEAVGSLLFGGAGGAARDLCGLARIPGAEQVAHEAVRDGAGLRELPREGQVRASQLRWAEPREGRGSDALMVEVHAAVEACAPDSPQDALALESRDRVADDAEALPREGCDRRRAHPVVGRGDERQEHRVAGERPLDDRVEGALPGLA